MKYFNKLIKKAKELNVDEIAKNTKKTIKQKMKENGIDQEIEKLKKGGQIISEAVKKSAKDVYAENKDTLERPVEIIDGVLKKVSPYKEHLKWTGVVAAGVVMPVSTLIASSVIYILSEDEEDVLNKDDLKTKEEQEKKDTKNETIELLNQKEPEVIKSNNSLVSININLKTKEITGTVLIGKLKNKSFEEIGVEQMQKLNDSLIDLKNNTSLNISEKDIKETKMAINAWLKFKKNIK